LTDLITETIDSRAKIPANLNSFKDFELVKKMSPKTKQEYVDYFKKRHQEKLTNAKSINELVDELAFDSQGNYNPSAAVKAIYGNNKNIPKSIIDNAFWDSKTKTPVLGANFTGSSPTAYHELLGHGGQEIDGLGYISSDNTLRNLSQRNTFTPDQDYFNTGSGGREPYAFAQELKKSLYDEGLLKNNNGTWETITPEMLEKARNIFKKSPKGNISGPQDGGRFFNEVRALEFVEDLEGLSKEMNKLIGANNPGDPDGKNKFDMLKANSMEVNT
jgi:hypothetical protein